MEIPNRPYAVTIAWRFFHYFDPRSGSAITRPMAYNLLKQGVKPVVIMRRRKAELVHRLDTPRPTYVEMIPNSLAMPGGWFR